MTLTARMYHDEHDLQRMRELVIAHTMAYPDHHYDHVGDLVWGMYQNTVFEPQENIRLWEDADGRLLGFAWAEPPNVVTLVAHPQLYGTVTLEPSMLAWAEQHVRDWAAPGTSERALWVTALESDEQRRAFFEQHGYTLDVDYMLVMRRELQQPIPIGPLPPGWSVRHVGGEAEWDARVETHREVWGRPGHPSRVTLAAYRRLRTAPGYTPELDIVAVAPDGTFASYCICWLDPVNHTGEFEPVGTRPAFRGMGVGKAVILEGLRRLREHGAHTALVYSIADNVASTKLYESAGFRTFNKHLFYTKQLE